MKYLTLLRGINVAGQKKIKMADLKVLYEDLKFMGVVTYIQTGNVIFETEIEEKTIVSILEKAIEKNYDFHVPVKLRSQASLSKTVKNCPFEEAKLSENWTKVLVSFLSEQPSQDKIDALLDYVKAPEELVMHGKEIYLFCPKGYGKTKLSNRFLERKLGVSATTRNWKSVVKLLELMTSIEK